MWKSLHAEYRRSLRVANPKTPSDWAARVATTRFMDDGEELIKRLGGSVDWESKKAAVVVRVLGQERTFDSGMDMVAWIVRDLAPKVEAEAAKP